MKRKGIFWGLLFVILTRCISAQASKYAVEVSAVAGINPNSLVFSWTADPAADHYYVFKKEIEDSSWGEPISVISGSSLYVASECLLFWTNFPSRKVINAPPSD